MAPPVCTCPSPESHARRTVVLTGGPGAGKTAVLEVIRRQLCRHTVVLPESAGIVYQGGFPRRPSEHARRAAQLAIFHVQVQLERMALGEGSPSLVLCDRGVLDGLAYWPGDEASFFAEAGITREAALARYDAVIHLRTPGGDGGYTHQNPLRTETPAEAAAIDARLVDAWRGHPRREEVASTADFMDKLHTTLALLRRELPACCRPVRAPAAPR